MNMVTDQPPTQSRNFSGLYFDGKEDTTRRVSNGRTKIGKQSNYTLVSQPEGKHFGFCVPDESTGNFTHLLNTSFISDNVSGSNSKIRYLLFNKSDRIIFLDFLNQLNICPSHYRILPNKIST